MSIFIGKDIFNIGSNFLINDYDFIPDGFSEEQIELCNSCFYRKFRIDLDIVREFAIRRGSSVRDYLPLFSEPLPFCKRNNCLLDKQNLLNLKELEELK